MESPSESGMPLITATRWEGSSLQTIPDSLRLAGLAGGSGGSALRGLSIADGTAGPGSADTGLTGFLSPSGDGGGALSAARGVLDAIPSGSGRTPISSLAGAWTGAG